MKATKLISALLKRNAWLAVFSLTILLVLLPVGYWASRICLAVSPVVLWLWGAFLLRKRTVLGLTVFFAGFVVIGWLCMPGRSGDPTTIRKSYVRCLKKVD